MKTVEYRIANECKMANQEWRMNGNTFARPDDTFAFAILRFAISHSLGESRMANGIDRA
jgi:hypothetical protein